MLTDSYLRRVVAELEGQEGRPQEEYERKFWLSYYTVQKFSDGTSKKVHLRHWFYKVIGHNNRNKTVAVALRHTPEDEKDNVVYDPRNPNHRSFSIEHFAGDVRLYAGLISTLQAEMQQATDRTDADEYDKMIRMLIGRTTTG